MFSKKTVFVIGAGASKEANLPLGGELTRTIAQKLNIRFDDDASLASGDSDIMDALRSIARAEGLSSAELYRRAACQIAAAMPLSLSIDNYLDAHRGDTKIELCGKLAIVQSILEAERRSKLHFGGDQGFDPSSVEGTWFSRFFQLLTEGVAKGDIETIFSKVAIITFNYDRCIEHFLAHSLAIYYAIPIDDAGRLVSSLRIIHLFGSVGSLPFQQSPNAVQFGHTNVNLPMLARQLRTFTERFEDDATLEAMGDIISRAKIIVFLGYAFHPQNMTLMGSKVAERMGPERIFATAYDMSASDRDDVKNGIAALLRVPLAGLRMEVRHDLTCAGLFKEYWRSLSPR